MGVLKEGTFLCDSVEGRSLHHRISIGSGMWPAPVISDAEQNVRPLGGGGGRAGENGDKKQKKNSVDHDFSMSGGWLGTTVSVSCSVDQVADVVPLSEYLAATECATPIRELSEAASMPNSNSTNPSTRPIP